MEFLVVQSIALFYDVLSLPFVMFYPGFGLKLY
jgi:hypothetical protein